MRVFRVRFFYFPDYEWIDTECIGTTENKIKAAIDRQWGMAMIKPDTLTIEETTSDIEMPYFFNETRSKEKHP